MATAEQIDYLSTAAAAADKVYAKVVELACIHESGSKTYDQMVNNKTVTCASSASIAYQEAGILASGKIVNHLDPVGGTDANILKQKPTTDKVMAGATSIPADRADIVWLGKKYADLPAKYRQKGVLYIQDSNVCICAGGAAIYSCNNAKSQINDKGQYIKDKVTSGYPFTSPILVAIIPKFKKVRDMDTLKQGDKGQQVKALQKLLGGLTVDGSFGAKTKAAVEAYQKKYRLTVDGITGPKTWTQLLSK